ncbi:MAG: quinone oxidoreductase family protein [Myxococcaceae bacterium]
MSLVIRIRQTGGPEVLQAEDVPVGNPGPGQVKLQQRAVGLNFIDTYHRTGHYPLQLPSGLGMEAAAVVSAVGPGVEGLAVGARVAYAGGPLGAYAEERLFPAERLVPIPEGVTDRQAAAVLLKGLTAHYLCRRTHVVKAGETVVVHAAAGGVGLLLCQWLKYLGANVIGSVGTAEKAELARANGCQHPLVLSALNQTQFLEQVVQLTHGSKAAVVYDSIGKDTLSLSLDCLAPLGLLAMFGASSGAPPPLDLQVLAQKGSLFVTRPTLNTYVAKREDLLQGAAEVFELVRKGVLQVHVNQEYPLRSAAQAHRDLEGRRTTGSTVLTVG